MRIILASAILLAASSPAFATIVINGSVGAGSNVVLGALSDPHTDAASSATPVSLLASASSSVSDGTYSVSSFSGVSGLWGSADSGLISISWGWNAAAGGSTDASSVNSNVAIPNWSYTFTATGNGSFAGNYVLTAEGDKFGLQPIYGTSDTPFGPYGGTVADPNGSGTFSVALVNGQTYTMAFYNYGNLFSTAGFNAVGDASAVIDWAITYDSVPEPASWAMMIAGFGLVGGAARRRRAVHA